MIDWDERFREWAGRISGNRAGSFKIPLVRAKRFAPDIPILLGGDKTPFFDSFTESVSLSSVEGQFLFRILREKQSPDARVFLTHTVPELYRYTFFTLEGIEGEFLTDFHGRAQLKNCSLDLSKVKVILYPASAVFKFAVRTGEHLEALTPDFEATAAKNWRIDVSLTEVSKTETLKIRAAAAHESVPRKIVLIMDRQKTLISVPVQGVSLFENPESALEYQINIYE